MVQLTVGSQVGTEGVYESHGNADIWASGMSQAVTLPPSPPSLALHYFVDHKCLSVTYLQAYMTGFGGPSRKGAMSFDLTNGPLNKHFE